jgi:uncharacterized protein (DUF486 family)
MPAPTKKSKGSTDADLSRGDLRPAPRRLERLHDLRLVRAPEEPGRKAVVDRGVGELGIALFEYLLMVPANRIGFAELSLPQLKILQEAITLAMFVPFAILYMDQPVKLDYLWASLCIMGAVYFVFRG